MVGSLGCLARGCCPLPFWSHVEGEGGEVLVDPPEGTVIPVSWPVVATRGRGWTEL